MSSKKITPKISTMERMRGQQAIEMTVDETKKAMGRAVTRRFARSLLLAGFILGLPFGALAFYLGIFL